MCRHPRLIIALTAAVMIVVALVVLDLVLTGGETALAVGQYGRHGSS